MVFPNISPTFSQHVPNIFPPFPIGKSCLKLDTCPSCRCSCPIRHHLQMTKKECHLHTFPLWKFSIYYPLCVYIDIIEVYNIRIYIYWSKYNIYIYLSEMIIIHEWESAVLATLPRDFFIALFSAGQETMMWRLASTQKKFGRKRRPGPVDFRPCVRTSRRSVAQSLVAHPRNRKWISSPQLSLGMNFMSLNLRRNATPPRIWRLKSCPFVFGEPLKESSSKFINVHLGIHLTGAKRKEWGNDPLANYQ